MTNYKQIQLTNTAVGDVAVDAFIPLGIVTRRINAPVTCCNTFSVANSTADTVTINDVGFYKITYSLSATSSEAGAVTVTLVVNGTDVYSVTADVAAADGSVNITLPYTIRVCTNSTTNTFAAPATVQFQNTGIALTGSASNLIVEKI